MRRARNDRRLKDSIALSPLFGICSAKYTTLVRRTLILTLSTQLYTTNRRLCSAQTLTASSAAAYAKPDQEDAQEFLSFLLVHTHEVRSRRRSPGCRHLFVARVAMAVSVSCCPLHCRRHLLSVSTADGREAMHFLNRQLKLSPETHFGHGVEDT